LRTSNLKHYGSDDKAVKPVKVKKGVKLFSAISAVVITAAILIIPTTTLAPNVDAYEDSKAASMAVGHADQFSAVITNNCVEVTLPVATEPQTTVAPTTAKPEESSKEEKKEEKKAETQPKTEAKEEETSSKEESESAESSESETSETSESSSSTGSAGSLSLSSYDRAKLERLVMGEAGSTGYYGASLVAQCIRDAMVRSNTTSIDEIISDYGYYGSTATEPNSAVKEAVSFIFDQGGSAVNHRIIVFYIGHSAWHETQNFVTEYCGMRFFDLNE
jgi:glucan-binding YG repeat protein